MKTFGVLITVAALFGGCASEKMLLNKSDRIIFLGDSITELGGQENGFVTLVEDSLAAKFGADAPAVINAGISGNKVTDLQARLDRDVISKNPTIVVIYIGINDVWHFALPSHSGTPADKFESGLRDIITRIHAVGSKVILCTPSVIGESKNGTNPQDEMLNQYADISRKVAKDMGVQLCDLHKDFIDYLSTYNPEDKHESVLTVDGVHLTVDGNLFVAGLMLKEFGY